MKPRSLRFTAFRALLLAGLAALVGCTPVGYFLEWPKTATVPSTDWADSDADFVRHSVQHPNLPAWNISYVGSGTPGGQRVIFVHGSPGQSSNWSRYLADVPSGYEFITVDRMGFGFTTPVRSEPSLEQQAAAIRPLVETEDGRKSILVGWSYGGPMIARAAVDFPEQIAGLVIVAGALDPQLEKVKWYQRLACAWPIRRFVRDSWRIANEELIPLRGELKKMSEGLGGVTVPVHILHGKQDDLVPFENVAFMQAAFQNSRDLQLVTFEEESHFIPFSQPESVWTAIRALAAQSPESE